MKEVKVLHCEFRDFESEANEMLRQGWNVAGFQPSPGYITGLFIRDVPNNPTPDTPISAAPDGQTLGERLRWLREHSGRWTDSTWFDMPFSPGYVCALEDDSIDPPLWALYKLAEVHGLTASDLLCGVVLEASDESEAGRDDE